MPTGGTPGPTGRPHHSSPVVLTYAIVRRLPAGAPEAPYKRTHLNLTAGASSGGEGGSRRARRALPDRRGQARGFVEVEHDI